MEIIIHITIDIILTIIVIIQKIEITIPKIITIKIKIIIQKTKKIHKITIQN